MIILAYVVGALFLWTASWLFYGSRIYDPSGDGRIGIFVIAFIWLYIPYWVITELWWKFFPRKG